MLHDDECSSCERGYYRDGTTGPMCTPCPDDDYTTSGTGTESITGCIIGQLGDTLSGKLSALMWN